MSEFAEFVSEQYTKLKTAYADKFPEDISVQNSAMMFALMQSQYIVDVMHNSEHLEPNYHGALLHMVNTYTQQSIDVYRKTEDIEPIDWEAGKSLLKEI